jgi:hypothetical protein
MKSTMLASSTSAQTNRSGMSVTGQTGAPIGMGGSMQVFPTCPLPHTSHVFRRAGKIRAGRCAPRHFGGAMLDEVRPGRTSGPASIGAGWSTGDSPDITAVGRLACDSGLTLVRRSSHSSCDAAQTHPGWHRARWKGSGVFFGQDVYCRASRWPKKTPGPRRPPYGMCAGGKPERFFLRCSRQRALHELQI